MFSFSPKTDEEINALKNEMERNKLLPDGVYPFVVKEITAQISQAGNSMLKVIISITKDHAEHLITDYILATDQMIYKLKHFCETLGLEKEYLQGSFAFLECHGNKGYAKIGTKKGDPRPDGTFFRDKNIVKDYVKLETLQQKTVVAEMPFDDTIPF